MHPPATNDKGQLSLGWLWASAFAIWTIVGLLLASSNYAGMLAGGDRISLGRAFGLGFLEAYVWIPVTVAAVLLTRRYPLEGRQAIPNSLRHLVAALVLSVVKMAAFHYIGIAAGWLRPGVTFTTALLYYSGNNLVTYALLVGVAHAFEYARRIRERELATTLLEAQLTRSQLQMLKMQIHPHFLFNTLHAISTLVHRDPAAAERTIANLSEMLRTTLAHEQSQEVALREELSLLGSYLEIEKIRLGDRLTVDTQIDPDTEHAMIPHLILQPLVENAIRHGIAPRRGGGRVQIQTSRSNGTLRVSVRDDGRGFPADSGATREGAVGLANTRARLEQLYGLNGHFAINSAPDRGTEVEISIPFRTHS